MNIEYKRLHLLATMISYSITLCLLIAYLLTYRVDYLLFLLWGVCISQLLFSLLNMKYYIIHFFFYLMMFVFLFSRPTIDFVRTGSFPTYQPDAYIFSFKALIVSLIGIWFGGVLAQSGWMKWKKYSLSTQSLEKNNLFDHMFVKKLRFISVIVFSVSYPFYVIRLVERLLFRLNTSYYQYYANFESKLPYITYIISTFMFYSLCIFLATKPKKIYATFFLALYVIANSIYLFIGTRNPVILSLLFSFIYFCMRTFGEDSQVWIGSREKMAIIVGSPVIMLLMGALNYIRDGLELKVNSVIGLLLDFIYKQGTSFGVLARGYLYQSSLPIREGRNFTFGPILDYFYRGTIGQFLFDSQPFTTTTNSIEQALISNSYAHNLSYLVLKKSYLNGHGIGGSYIMDVYTDYHWIGIFLFSMFLGMVFVYMMKASYGNHILLFTISLMILGELFFTPRSSLSSSFFYLFTMQFWIIITFILFVSAWISKKIHYMSYQTERIKLNV